MTARKIHPSTEQNMKHLTVKDRTKGKSGSIFKIDSTTETVSCGCPAMVDSAESAEYLGRLYTAAINAQNYAISMVRDMLFVPAKFVAPDGHAEKVTPFDLFAMNGPSARAFFERFATVETVGGEKTSYFAGVRPDRKKFRTVGSFMQYLSREIFSDTSSPFGKALKTKIIESMPEEFRSRAVSFVNESVIKVAIPKVACAIRKKVEQYTGSGVEPWCLSGEEARKASSKSSGKRADHTWKRIARDVCDAIADIDPLDKVTLYAQLNAVGPRCHEFINRKNPVDGHWPENATVRIPGLDRKMTLDRPSWNGQFRRVYGQAIEKFMDEVAARLPKITGGSLVVLGEVDGDGRESRIRRGDKFDCVFNVSHVPYDKEKFVPSVKLYLQTRTRHTKDGYYPSNFDETLGANKVVQCSLRFPPEFDVRSLTRRSSKLIAQLSYERVSDKVRFAGPCELSDKDVVGIDANSSTFKINTTIPPKRKCSDIPDWHEAFLAFRESNKDHFVLNAKQYADGIQADMPDGLLRSTLMERFAVQVDSIVESANSGKYGLCLFPTLGIPLMLFENNLYLAGENPGKDPLSALFTFMANRKDANGNPFYGPAAREAIGHTRAWRRATAAALAEKLRYITESRAWQETHDPVNSPFGDTGRAAELSERCSAAMRTARQIEEHVLSKTLFSKNTVAKFKLFALEELDFDGMRSTDGGFVSLGATLRSMLGDMYKVGPCREASGYAEIELPYDDKPAAFTKRLKELFKERKGKCNWEIVKVSYSLKIVGKFEKNSCTRVESSKTYNVANVKFRLTTKGFCAKNAGLVPAALTKVLHLPELQHTMERLCAKNATSYISVNPKYTSCTCSKCQAKTGKIMCGKGESYCKEMHVPYRRGEYFHCYQCGTEMNANFNAALNVRGSGIRAIGSIGKKKTESGGRRMKK